MKIVLQLTLIFVCHQAQSAALRTTPKVYNALITTDQNLTPSRAYPVIQPHLQETYALPSYSYRSYAPLGFHNRGFHYGSGVASSIAPYNGFHNYPRLSPGFVNGGHFLPRDEIHTTLPPIPVNNLGLPPALIPINSFEYGNLAPYPHSSHPLIYDQFGGYFSNLLPPYPFYPPALDGKDIADKEKKVPNKDDDSSGSSSASNGSSGSGSNGSSAAGGDASSDGGSGSSSGGMSSNINESSGGGSPGSSGSSSSSTRSSRSQNLKEPAWTQ